MFARVMTIQIQSGKLEEATAVYRDYVLPVARQQKGFVSALLLTDARSGKAVSTTVWETEANQNADAANGYIQRELARIGTLIVAPPTQEAFEVSVHTYS
ncbi:antibiotic biosynthesis monooxygenase [Pseudomonas sp. B21-010]|jgi:heme-degrading monooxygenase HmoA|uniref:antibiotic biosynthesis monooxygenase family protein n=1 Tax=unclassified Pseudomonas TaxID=196821 RepID=UPI00215F4AB1|nr:antibiotic biosynthesis monooxygenase [Pseudomonas sp. B21-010]UVM60562.1 antibiotic biosynthesis monooxygenase [Pseudomonas sp. B21-010]